MTSNSTTSGKSRLASSEGDINLYLTPQGLTRECWSRLGEQVKNIFGAPDLVEEKENVDEIESGSAEKKVRDTTYSLGIVVFIHVVSFFLCAACSDPLLFLRI